jgi:hypothetical protein
VEFNGKLNTSLETLAVLTIYREIIHAIYLHALLDFGMKQTIIWTCLLPQKDHSKCKHTVRKYLLLIGSNKE